MSDDTKIPTDDFSRRRRELADNPTAASARATLPLADWYGNLETWVIEMFRAEGAKGRPETTVFLQRSSKREPVMLMLPPEVMAAVFRQQDQLITRGRKRAARKAAATRKALGIVPRFTKKGGAR
jgi:hypothetical protein